MTPATCGPTSLVPLAHYDPASSCWRTSQGMFPSAWPTSSETCPRSGMTRGGVLYELPTPGPRTPGPASSSWPTPRATRGGSASETLALLPTPIADNARGLPQHGTGYQSLPNAVVALLPTPITSDQYPPRKVPRKDGKAHEWDQLANAVWYLFSGAPTGQRSSDGPTLWDDPPPTPPSPAAPVRD